MVETQEPISGTSHEFDTCEEIVRECLREDERCRNDDLWLIFTVWQRKQQVKLYVPYDRLQDMLSPETIRRTRQKIQNTMKEYPPTDEKVIKRRKQREQEIHDWAVRSRAGWRQGGAESEQDDDARIDLNG